jgi:RNA polymerase sigma factor (sigma-70 family)
VLGENNMYGYIENCIENMIMEKFLNELDEQEHKIIMLYYWWGYRDAEIGKFLSESQQMVNYKRNRALRKIKSAISK